MPSYFQRRDPETGEVVDVPYYDVPEAAALLKVSQATVRRRCRDHDWPHEHLGRIWFRQEHIERIHELSTVDPDRLAEGDAPARLGVVAADAEMEPIR